jgi:hypothetical protein
MMVTMRAKATGAHLLACTAVAAGCTSNAPGVEQLGVAACRQAAAGFQDPASRAGADQACQYLRSGNGRDVSRAAKRTARQKCLNSTQQIVDPVARRTMEGFCPKV